MLSVRWGDISWIAREPKWLAGSKSRIRSCLGLPSKRNRLPSHRSETPVKTEETPVVSPRDTRRIGARQASMVARNTAASVREANIHNIHSSQPDLYTGVFICVLTSEDCEDWKLREHFTCSYFRRRNPHGVCATRGNEKSTRGAAFLHKGKRKLHKGRRAAPPGEAKHPTGLSRTPRRCPGRRPNSRARRSR